MKYPNYFQPNMLLRADSHAMECLAKMLTLESYFVQSDAISGSSSSAVRYAGQNLFCFRSEIFSWLRFKLSLLSIKSCSTIEIGFVVNRCGSVLLKICQFALGSRAFRSLPFRLGLLVCAAREGHACRISSALADRTEGIMPS